MLNMSIEDFSKALASKTSVPGGGGASAYAAALGIALGNMVGEFTVGKKKYADVEEDILRLMKRADELRGKLLLSIDEDAKAFEPLSKAYAISKDDPDRDEIMEKCLRTAASVPYSILRLTCESIDLQREFANKGSRLMISDAATGASLLFGALRGAAVNVFVNTSLMKDRDYADKLNEDVNTLVKVYEDKSNQIYLDVLGRI